MYFAVSVTSPRRTGNLPSGAIDNVDAYPEINRKELAQSDPEIIFLSSEPFPFNEKHKKSFQEICPDAKVFLVDGEMFSWYGSRLTNIPFYLQKLLQTIS